MKKQIISLAAAISVSAAMLCPVSFAEATTVGSEDFTGFSEQPLGENPSKVGTNNTFYKGSSNNDNNMSATIESENENKYLNVKLAKPTGGDLGNVQFFIRPGNNNGAELTNDIIHVSYKLKINSLGGEVDVGTLVGKGQVDKERDELIAVKSDGTSLKVSGNESYTTVLKNVGTGWHTLDFTLYKDTCTFDLSVDSVEKLAAAKMCRNGGTGKVFSSMTKFTGIYLHSEKTAIDVCYDDILFQTEEKAPEAPALASTVPTDGATDVAVTSDVKLNFNMAIDEASLDNNITVSPAADFATALSQDGKTVTLSFDEPLAKSTEYTVTVGKDIAEAAAEGATQRTLGTDKTFTFTTSKKDQYYIGAEDFEGYTLTDGAASVDNNASDVYIKYATNTKNFVIKGNNENKYLHLDKTATEEANASIYGNKDRAKMTDAVISYKYRMKINSVGDNTNHFGSIYGTYLTESGAKTETGALIKIYKQSDGLIFVGNGGTAGENGSTPSSNHNLMTVPFDTDWHEYEIIIDRVSKKYTLKRDGKVYCKDITLCTSGGVFFKNIDSVDYAFFYNKDAAYDAALDDIEFSRVECLKVQSVSPADKSAVSLNPSITLNFNKPVIGDDLNNKVKLTCGENEIACTPALSADKKSLTVSASELDYKTAYTLSISGLKSDEEVSVPMAEDYTLSFTTKPRALDITGLTVTADGGAISNIASALGKTISIAATVKNTESQEGVCEVIAALKTKDGETIQIESQAYAGENKISVGAYKITDNLKINVPQTGEYVLEVFLWKSLDSGIPLIEKLDF